MIDDGSTKSEQEMKQDKAVQDKVEEVLEEAKLMVGVRAACSVILTKLPLAKSVNSKAATIRETKRLINGLKCKAFPAAINAWMDDAASS